MNFMNSNNNKKIVLFVGNSLSSLVLATYHKSTNQDDEVVIIDGSSKVGGGNSSHLAKNSEFFDYGMRVYYECNIKELDDIVTNSLPDGDLVFLKDNKKDLAACYFNGKLQLNSPCLDIRKLSSEEKSQIMGEVRNAKRNIDKHDYRNCSDYLIDRFGNTIPERYLFPILKNFYNKDVSQLTVDASTAHFGVNERIILFDKVETLKLMQNEHYKMRLAFPDQGQLPEPYSTRSARGIYPQKLGMQHLLDGLKDNFIAVGGKFIFNVKIKKLHEIHGSITALTYTNKNSGDKNTINLKALFWGAPLILLAKLLGYKHEYTLERGKRVHLAHIILDQKLNLGELYYLFNFDPSCKIFRIVNYSGFCPGSSKDGLFRATVEYWSDTDSVDFVTIKDELLQMSVIDQRHKVMFKEITSGPAFPLQSVNNQKHMEDVRNYFQSRGLRNVLAFGQSAKKHTFYTPDILLAAFAGYKRMAL